MQHLFSSHGKTALTAIMAQQPLLAFDFDGTLAPIVSHPDDARVSHTVARRLACLAQALPLAIITGRSVADVRERLTFNPRLIIGNHGAEDPSVPAPSSRTSVFDGMRVRLRQRRDELMAAGITIEDKNHSIALHYRLAHNHQQAYDLIMDVVDSVDVGLEILSGKLVVNIVATESPDKADALAELVERCGAQSAVFVGDDINDEPVFARAEPSWLTIKIGIENANSQARFYLDNSHQILTMLNCMLSILARLKE